jgi:hypothetical protein
MKQRILVTAVASAVLFLSACGTTKNSNNTAAGNSGINPGGTALVPIAEQRLAVSEFKTQGVRVYYSFWGDVEAIEATGDAAVWGNSVNAARESYRMAELEAKKSLNDFLNRESFNSTVSVRIISKNLEKAQDQTTNRMASNIATSDAEVANSGGEQNTAIRKNALDIASRLSTTMTTQSRGILGGLYLKDATIIDGGRAVRVTLRWDKKHNDARREIRNLMAQ